MLRKHRDEAASPLGIAAVVAVVAASLAAASASWAIAPEFLWVLCTEAGGTGEWVERMTNGKCLVRDETKKGSFEKVGVAISTSLPFTSKMATGAAAPELEVANGDKIKCTSDTGSGEITGASATKKTLIKFTGCEEPKLKVECENKGSGSKEIETNELNGTLVYINHSIKEVGVALTPATAKGLFTEFTCSPSLLSSKLKVGEGTLGGKDTIVCVITPTGSPSNASTLTCSQTTGIQAPSEFEEEVGGVWTKIPSYLETESTGSIKFTWEKSGQLSTDTISMSEVSAEEVEVEIMG